jgi:Ca2+-binding EF-hand superfamily protein
MRRFSVSYLQFQISVYFRIFDVDGNKKVDENDLAAIMKMIFGSRMPPEDTKML